MNRTESGEIEIINRLKNGRIDWLITLALFIMVMDLAGVLFIFPDQSNNTIGQVRFFFGDTLGVYYLSSGWEYC